jgi:hypothetical protein
VRPRCHDEDEEVQVTRLPLVSSAPDLAVNRSKHERRPFYQRVWVGPALRVARLWRHGGRGSHHGGFLIDPDGRIRSGVRIAQRANIGAEAAAMAKYVADIERGAGAA